MQSVFQLWQRAFRSVVSWIIVASPLVVVLIAIAVVLASANEKPSPDGRPKVDPSPYNGKAKDIAGAREAVRNFLLLATGDGWLSQSGRAEIGRLMGHSGGDGDSVLHMVTVIKKFQVLGTDVSEGSARVGVEYDELGFLDENFYKWVNKRRKTRVEFLLKKEQRGSWIVVSYGWDGPHIFWKNAAGHLETMSKTANDPDYFRSVAKQVEVAAKSRDSTGAKKGSKQ
jgi:hypothetical protein